MPGKFARRPPRPEHRAEIVAQGLSPPPSSDSVTRDFMAPRRTQANNSVVVRVEAVDIVRVVIGVLATLMVISSVPLLTLARQNARGPVWYMPAFASLLRPNSPV